MRRSHQALPQSGPQREALREKGQFWTPQWVAEAMVAYVLGSDSKEIFDPAVGAGAFFRAARSLGVYDVRLLGREVDPNSLEQALRDGLTVEDLRGVEIRDFVGDPPSRPLSAVVANPPYIRHHRIDAETKAQLDLLSRTVVGKKLDRRAGYHVFFLIRALSLLAPRGRLAFILPADTCEGVFARDLWQWIGNTYALDAVATFVPEATPFPGVDTNAVVVMIENSTPKPVLRWASCTVGDTTDFRHWVEAGFPDGIPSLKTVTRTLDEALETGLSRPPQTRHEGPTLGQFAKVVRGIATGANDFFFLTGRQVQEYGLPTEFFVRAIGRTRDVTADQVTLGHLDALDRAGRPTFLLSLDDRPISKFPPSIQAYLERGVADGLPDRPLIAARSPWYKMERRDPPPFLFAYLGRRNARFIRNGAQVVPLTGFLCVYPLSKDPDLCEGLWKALTHPDTLANLQLVGKSYGSGAIKVEPRALERLPIASAATSFGATSSKRQATLQFV